ncbi:MAG TPA: CvpA family protein [Verrucomicrobiae bacterium]
MSIWILAVVVMILTALAGWRLGAIRAAISFVGILFAVLLAVPVGKLVHPLLPHLGAGNPIYAWALAPIVGFILVAIVLKIPAQMVHNRVEHFYKYNAGDLRLVLWTRMNSRLGICVGLLNGALYFVLITFLIFNLTYWTTQVAVAPQQPLAIRLVNQLGNDLQATHLTRTASAVGTLPAEYYQFADLAGFLMQNPQVGPRLAEYPALTALWERDDFQALVSDPTVTNALASGATLGELLNNPSVRAFLENKDQTKLVTGILQTNLSDLTAYLQTGKSAKYGGEKIIGRWEFNPAVTVAWLRQSRPKMPASEMRSVRAWMTQAYAKTSVLVSGDNLIFIKSLPRIKTVAGQPPTTEQNDWKGDWQANGTSYDLHLTFSGEEKFLTATAEELRLSVKDGKNLLVFDRAD